MTAKHSNSELGNDVQTIRQILFGEQLHSIQAQIEALGDTIAALQNETRLLREDLETEGKTRHKESNTLEAKLERTKEQILKKISDELTAHQNLHESLITSLASALLKYSEQTGSSTESK